eukprot:scaffold98284_cov15-Tisochrysis_lutea.AAC.1
MSRLTMQAKAIFMNLNAIHVITQEKCPWADHTGMQRKDDQIVPSQNVGEVSNFGLVVFG